MAVVPGTLHSRRLRKPWKIVTYAQASRRIRNWPEYIVRTWRLPEIGVFETRNGATYRVPLRLMHTFRQVVVNDTYDMKRLVAELGPTPTLVDIGANAGFFSIQAAELMPGAEIHGYEPLPGNYRALEENRVLNPALAPRVHGHARAVTGAPVDFVRIYTQTGKTETGLASRHTEWTSGEKDSFSVAAVTLSSIVAALSPGTIDLLKVDCEGSEYDILFNTPPSILRRIERIVMEVHTRPFLKTTRKDMIAFLREQGYSIEEAVGRKGKNAMVWARRG